MGTLIGWEFESEARAKGFTLIAGVDEVGRGPLAGPVVAGAVILPEDFDCTGINDSKKLNAEQREKAYERIMADATAVGFGIIGPSVIDEINILRATHMAMKAALDDLGVVCDFVFVDGLPVQGLCVNCTALVKGDSRCVSIAAASIVAKVTRDRMMQECDLVYPQYGFGTQMGYGTKDHLAAIQKHGPCPHHRMSFAPIKQESVNCVLPGLE